MPAIVDVPTGAGRHQRLRADHARLLHRVGQVPPRRRPAAVSRRPRDEIDEVAKRIYTEVNNGVYRCGFAGSQESYDKAYDRLFTALDWLSERLAKQRYLVGDTITEADVRLFTTLARFDPVYHGHFKTQPQQARRDAGAVGIRARPVPDAGIRRHHRLRPDQAALLHRAQGHQPDADRAQGAGPVQLAHPARPGSVGRQTVWRRHTARTDAARANGCPTVTGQAEARPFRIDHSACHDRTLVAFRIDARSSAAARRCGSACRDAGRRWEWSPPACCPAGTPRPRRNPRRRARVATAPLRSPAAPTTAPDGGRRPRVCLRFAGFSQLLKSITSQYRYGPTRVRCPCVYALISGCSCRGC